jgi:hypothetical protein
VLAQGSIIVLLSFLTLNAGYGFQGIGRSLGELPFVSRLLGGAPLDGADSYSFGRSGNRFRSGFVENLRIPLPEDYVLGIDLQRRDFEAGFRSYLHGEIRHRGWWYYYLYALAVKLPLGLVGLFIWSFCDWLNGRGAPSGETVLWLPAVTILAVVSSQIGFNHHMRYILPCCPFVIISTGKLAQFWNRSTPLRGLGVTFLLIAAIASVLSVHPHYSSYFNEAAGGPDHGQEHLLDSNIDWGQDLLFLKRWLNEHTQEQPLKLAYYNIIDPRIVGIDYKLPPPGPDRLFQDDPARLRSLGPHPGYFAISVNFVQGLDCFAPDGMGNLRAIRANQYAYFQRFQPIAKAGYSIFIYHITLEDANRVRHELGLPLLTEESSSPENKS